MKIALAVLGVLLCSQARGPQADPAAELKKLQGVWQGNMGGKMEITIKDDVMTAKKDPGNEDMGEGTFKLDLSANPKTIDVTRTKPNRGQKYLGLYSLEGDTLKWCTGNAGQKRPKDLTNNPGNGQYLLTLKRK